MLLLSILHALKQMALPNWMTLLPPVSTGGSKHVEEDKGPFILNFTSEHQKC